MHGTCFETLAGDDAWHAFTAGEARKVDGFLARWALRPGDRVLEPGCGSGRLTALLAARVGPAGRVLAFDSSLAFVDRALGRGLPPNVTLRRADARSAALEPASFDHVVCFNVFPHLVPLAEVAARLAGALRPGGSFWIAHTCSREFVNDIHRRGPEGIRDHLLPAPAELEALLAGAGLREIEIDDAADRFFARATRP
jgi:demethylmenaquinone methyltransferase/2-methoxy-6-polyprenyl-1,4-benzoquinol methylase